MDYEKLSEEKLDTIMQAIRRENGKTEAVSPSPAAAAPAGEIERNAHIEDAQYHMDSAIVGTQIGHRKAPMYKKRGLARKLARVVELIYLRVAEFSNRDLRDFCSAVLGVFRVLVARVERLFMNDQILEDRISALEGRISEQDSTIERLRKENAALDQRVRRLSSDNSALQERLSACIGQYESTRLAIDEKAAVLELLHGEIDSLSDKSGELSSLLSEQAEALAELGGQLTQHTSKDEFYSSPSFSGLYHDFEERFRGPAEDVSRRLEGYRHLLVSKIGSLEGRRCIDLGCGRGEMLDFFRKSGVSERVGVDINPVQLMICAGKGHDTVEKDCFDYLSELPDNSVDVISAIQLIEHLRFEELITLTRECFRVLRHGGAVLFETPNCENLITAATWFPVDPTHAHPVHPELMRFLGEREGFCEVEIVGVNADEYANRLDSSADGAEILNALLFGARDYAFIGVKR